MKKCANRTLQIFLITALAALISSCSAVNEESPLVLVNSSGNHFAGWIQEHGTYAVSDETLCTSCHGDDLDGGITSVSCFTASYDGQSCHANGPGGHPADWLNKNATTDTWHAEAYRTQMQIGGLDCADCHTPPALDDPDGGKCVICHFDLNGSRSPGGWTHGATNHGDFAGSPEEIICVTCHEVNNRFGNEPFCHNCHLEVTVPHTSGWLDKTAPDFHALAYSPSTDSCSICHDPAQPTNPPGYVCLDCHFSEDGSQRVPAGSGYVHGERSQEHKAFTADEAQVCINCHETNVQYSNQASCHNCHALVEVPHTSGWLDKSAQDFHALAYSPDYFSCTTCHDPAQPATPPGYVCLDCHFSEDGSQRVPAGSTYAHGDTSPEHRAFNTDEALVCTNCHDTNILYSNQATCHNCHALVAPHDVEYLDHNSAVATSDEYGAQCSSCHSIYPPPVTTAPECTFCHADDSSSPRSPYTFTACTSCHGQPPDTGRHRTHSDEACGDCHQGAGSGSGLNHFYDGAVDVVFSASASNFSYSGGRCSGTCHQRTHNFTWK